MRIPLSLLAVLLVPALAIAQNRGEDEYTRYELLAPETSSFKIIYDVTAVTPGAKFYFNAIRKGSIATDESVIDLASGAPLKFEQISGAAAKEAGLTSRILKGNTSRSRSRVRCPPAVRQECASSRPTRIRRATSRTVTPSSSIVRSASSGMRWCCRRSTS